MARVRLYRMLAAAAVSLVLASGLVSTTEARAAEVPSADNSGAPAFSDGLTRLAGTNRYETSARISGTYASGVPAAFVALGTKFPDALSAASAAANLGGPLLLTTGDSVPAVIADELRRLDPAEIFVIGDENSITEHVRQEISAIAPTERLGGVNRFETGRIVVRSSFTASSHAIIASGLNFPDALAASGAAGSRHAPVVLVDGRQGELDAETGSLLTELGVTSVSIAGDANAISAGIEQSLRAMGVEVARYGGAGRYETAALINDAYFPGTARTAFLAAGTKFPDALSAAALAGLIGAPLYTTQTECVPRPIRDSMNARSVTALVVLGDENSVSANAANRLGCLSVGQPSVTGSPVVGNSLQASPGVWSAGTSFSYSWLVDGSPSGGGQQFTVPEGAAGKRVSVRVTGTLSGYVSAAAESAQTSTVSYPGRTKPVGTSTCPSWAPIKGNASSMIYHVPGSRYYDKTNPEECFATVQDAEEAGYRAPKN